MVTKAVKTKEKKPIAPEASELPLPLQNLHRDLTSTRLKAPGTVSTYLLVGRHFLAHWKGKGKPGKRAFQDYFSWRRSQGISERALLKEFSALHRLSIANEWDWPFGKFDSPEPEEREPTPAMEPEMVQQLIESRDRLSPAERFYLALATTWIVRREDLARIEKRSYDEESIVIHHSKKGKLVRHLIPPVLQPIIQIHHPFFHGTTALSEMFVQICKKAGVPREKGVGWHSIRRCMETMIEFALAKNNLMPSLAGDYAGWKPTKTGARYSGAATSGIYRRPEIIYSDKYGIDRVIYEVHPFLPLWGKKAKFRK